MRELLEWAANLNTAPKLVFSVVVILVAGLILYVLWTPQPGLPSGSPAVDGGSRTSVGPSSERREEATPQIGDQRPSERPQPTASGAKRSPASDTDPPRLVAFEIEPVEVDARTGPAVVELRARLADELSGVAGRDYPSSQTQVRFRSPSGQFVTAMFLSDEHLVEGTRHHGQYRSQVRIAQFSEVGVWRVEYFLLVDQAGNSRSLSERDLESMGFPTSFSLRE